MRILALDIGEKKTGVAYADSDIGVPLTLPTIRHRSGKELNAALGPILVQRRVTAIIVGLPLLPSGKEGSQAKRVRVVVASLHLPEGTKVTYFDERYTTPRGAFADPDAEAACSLLLAYLDRGLSA